MILQLYIFLDISKLKMLSFDAAGSHVKANHRLNLSFVKDNHTVGKKWPEMVVKVPVISCHYFGT